MELLNKYRYLLSEFSKTIGKLSDPQCTMDIVLKMNEFDYSALDTAYGNIDFMFTNSTTRSYIYDAIYKKSIDLRGIIAEKSFHFKEYKKAGNGNLSAMKKYIEEIDKVIMSRTNKDLQNNDGSVCSVSSNYNKITIEMTDELKGRYFEIMYGRKKGYLIPEICVAKTLMVQEQILLFIIKY